MKRSVLFIPVLVSLLVCLCLSGCVTKASWRVVRDLKVNHTPNSNLEGFLNPNFGITIGCNVGESYWTKDGGESWTRAYGATICRFCLDIVDENLAWNGGDGDEVCYSKDGGQSWTPVNDVTVPGAHSQIDFIDDKTGWVGAWTSFASTQDGGMNWTRMTLPEGIHTISALHLRTPQEGYLLSGSGQFCITKDGGKTWDVRNLGFEELGLADLQNKKGHLIMTRNPMADMAFTDEKNGTLVFIGVVPDKGFVTWCFTTNNGGSTWTKDQIHFTDGFIPSSLFLSDDGKYLTLSSMEKRMILLERK